MGIFDSEFVETIAAENDARAKAAAEARNEALARENERRRTEERLRTLVDEALGEFPAIAEQLGIQPYRVSYLGAPFLMKHHAKVWPVASWYSVDKAGHTYKMDHLGAYDAWIKEAKAGNAWVEKVERQEVVENIAFQTLANIRGSLEESVRDMLAPYLRTR